MSLRPVIADSYGPASFGHIMSPMYACGYYSYLWSLVYSCDIFSVFKEKGIYNSTEGTALREKILSKGSSEKASVLLHDFLQREPKMDAFLEEMGLKQLVVCCNKSMIPLQQLFTYQIELAEEAILGQRSAASLATGPVIPDPFISPLGFTITPALSICYFFPITIHPQSRDTLRSFFSSSFSVLPQRQA